MIVVILRAMTGKYHHDPLIIETILSHLSGVKAIYRYGSAGSVYERQDSDIDIAILIDHVVPFQDMMKLTSKLMAATGRDIDFYDMKKYPVTLRVQIVLEGNRIYSKDLIAAETYDTHVLSDYVRLNEERRLILKDVQQREQIYG